MRPAFCCNSRAQAFCRAHWVPLQKSTNKVWHILFFNRRVFKEEKCGTDVVPKSINCCAVALLISCKVHGNPWKSQGWIYLYSAEFTSTQSGWKINVWMFSIYVTYMICWFLNGPIYRLNLWLVCISLGVKNVFGFSSQSAIKSKGE